MLKFEGIFGVSYKTINEFLLKMGTNVLIAVAILVIGFWMIKFATNTMKKILRKSKTDESLVTFLSSLVAMSAKALVIITAVTQVGVEMTSFVAILGAAGLAVGMAFSGTLSNFAGGVMILIFKPFKVGDQILTQGEQGIVKEIQIFNTYLHTADNKVIILPNGPIANGNITNFTKADKRRVDLIFGISYGDNVEKTRKVLADIVAADERILKDPVPFIGLGALTNNSVDIVLQVWTKTELHSKVTFDLNEQVYKAFEENEIHFANSKVVVGNEA